MLVRCLARWSPRPCRAFGWRVRHSAFGGLDTFETGNRSWIRSQCICIPVRVDVLVAVSAGRGGHAGPDRPTQPAHQLDDWRRIGAWADTLRSYLEDRAGLSPGGPLCGRRGSDLPRTCTLE